MLTVDSNYGLPALSHAVPIGAGTYKNALFQLLRLPANKQSPFAASIIQHMFEQWIFLSESEPLCPRPPMYK